MALACAFFSCLCAYSQQGVRVERGESGLFVTSRLKPKSESALSVQNALELSENKAYSDFIIYCRAGRIIIPNELEDLREKIEACYLRTFSLSAKIDGAKIVRKEMENGEAVCTLQFPQETVDAVLLSIPEILVRADSEYISSNPVLHYEILRRSGGDANISFFRNADILHSAASSAPLTRIPQAWLADESVGISGLSDNDLLDYANESLGIEGLYESIRAELRKRGFVKLAQDLPAIKISVVDADSSTLKFLDEINAAALSELNESFSYLYRIVAAHGGRIAFKTKSERISFMKNANDEFASATPTLARVRGFCEKTLSYAPDSSAFNLIGRTLELEGKSHAAAAFYLQSYTLDPKNPYAAVNLACIADKLGLSDAVKFWISAAEKNSTLTKWGQTKINQLKNTSQDL